jgi:hypothetical protein
MVKSAAVGGKRRVYWRWRLGILLVVMGGAPLAYGIWLAIDPTRFYPEANPGLVARVGTALFAIVASAWIIRRGLARVIIDDVWVTVKNPLRTYRVRKDEIRTFEIGNWSFASPGICLLRMKDGTTRPALGVSGAPTIFRPNNRASVAHISDMNLSLTDGDG